jgi:hypothetical protein
MTNKNFEVSLKDLSQSQKAYLLNRQIENFETKVVAEESRAIIVQFTSEDGSVSFEKKEYGDIPATKLSETDGKSAAAEWQKKKAHAERFLKLKESFKNPRSYVNHWVERKGYQLVNGEWSSHFLGNQKIALNTLLLDYEEEFDKYKKYLSDLKELKMSSLKLAFELYVQTQEQKQNIKKS